MIIGYARVSTVDQGLEVQMDKLKAHGADMTFSEKLSGATTDKRAELQAALRILRPGDVLLITKLDRLARSTRDLIDVVETIKKSGATLKVIDQSIDTETPAGRAMMQMLGVFAEFELNIRRERQAEGIAAAKARGVYKPKANQHPPQVWSAASRYMKAGLSYEQTAARTGISEAQIRRRFPQYKDERKVQGALKREAARKAREMAHEPASAPADPALAPPIPSPPQPQKTGLLGRLFG